MTMPRKVNREEWGTKSKGNGVPGVSVLSPAVEHHYFRRLVSPDDSRDPASRLDLDELTSQRRRTGERDSQLIGIFRQETEFVIVRRRRFRGAVRTASDARS